MEKKIFKILAILITAFFVFNIIAAALFCRILFSRDDDPDIYSSVASEYVAKEEISRKVVSFKSENNSLSGWIYDCKDEKGLLIIAPGFHSSCDMYLALVIPFFNDGWDVMVYDYTGSHTSSGKWSVGLQQSHLDLLSAVNYADSLPEYSNSPIAVMGHSMGGYAAAVVLADTDRLCACSTISAFDNPNQFMRSMAAEYIGGIPASISYIGMVCYNKLVFSRYSDSDASDIITQCDLPVMVVQGSNDEIVRYGDSLYNALQTEAASRDNILYEYIDEPYRNSHTFLWLTQQGAKYAIDTPPDIQTIDSKILLETEDEFISKLLVFYSQAAECYNS